MHESFCSSFLRTTAGISSRTDAFEESRSAVTGMECMFSLLLEGRGAKETPVSLRLEFLKKTFARKSVLSDAKEIISGPLVDLQLVYLC